jgi:2-(1,2-epoxy-1,2-dihydrophenyl)acetyl-CoA isomerase
MEYTTIGFEIRAGVAHITLNRPAAANSINLTLAQELFDAVLHCDEEPAIRAVLLTATGNIFCAGGDLKSFHLHQGPALAIHLKQVTAFFHAAISRLTHMDAPVVAAIQGSAAGAGLSLICACDMPMAAQSTRFTMAYTRAGLTPDGSISYFLPRLVGARRALDLALTNRALSAKEACEWGIVSRVVADGELPEAAQALARQLANGPKHAFGVTKRLMLGSFSQTLESQMEHEARAIAQAIGGAESREGIAAFLEKRQPDFTKG